MKNTKKLIVISKELSERLINEGIDPLKVSKIDTINDKYKRKIITKITLVDGNEHELIDDFVYYAARKSKTL